MPGTMQHVNHKILWCHVQTASQKRIARCWKCVAGEVRLMHLSYKMTSQLWHVKNSCVLQMNNALSCSVSNYGVWDIKSFYHVTYTVVLNVSSLQDVTCRFSLIMLWQCVHVIPKSQVQINIKRLFHDSLFQWLWEGDNLIGQVWVTSSQILTCWPLVHTSPVITFYTDKASARFCRDLSRLQY